MKTIFLNTVSLFLFTVTISFSSAAQEQLQSDISDTNALEELNPADPNIEQKLKEMDQQYFEETGKSPFLMPSFTEAASCRKFDCPVYVTVNKNEQRAYLYLNGSLEGTWLTSTGKAGSETPDFEGHPNGRIYDAYTSKKNPGGDYKGLGNMPYAVFLRDGYAIHGTPESNFKKLGTKASHGCIRLHPDHGKTFNRLVRQYGIAAVWVSII